MTSHVHIMIPDITSVEVFTIVRQKHIWFGQRQLLHDFPIHIGAYIDFTFYWFMRIDYDPVTEFELNLIAKYIEPLRIGMR